jgi:glucokinase
MMNIFIDVGGKGLKATYEYEGAIDYDFLQQPSLATESRDVIIKNFCQLVYNVWDKASKKLGITKVDCISMAFPGPFDYLQGICKIQGLSKYDSIYNVVIPDAMRQYFKLMDFQFVADAEFKFLHDVEAYALGVCRTYNLAYARALYLCIGTGAGSAYSVNGRIVKNGKGIAQNGWFYNHAFKDATIDDYISVRGIMDLAQKHLVRVVNPLELARLAESGNPHALAAYAEFGDNLCSAMKMIIEKFQADTFILGGNISKSSPLFIDELNQYAEKKNIELIVESETSNMIFNGLYAMNSKSYDSCTVDNEPN